MSHFIICVTFYLILCVTFLSYGRSCHVYMCHVFVWDLQEWKLQVLLCGSYKSGSYKFFCVGVTRVESKGLHYGAFIMKTKSLI